jgi:orotidine-5'-phosphate decarboxylase
MRAVPSPRYIMGVSNLATHAADRLLTAIEQKRSPVCVGLDPVLEKTPQAMQHMLRQFEDTGFDDAVFPARCLYEFCKEVLGAVAPHVPCVKVQSACFERFGEAGVSIIHRVASRARRLGLQVILDAKRGDIGVTAEHYAASAFAPAGDPMKNSAADWLTINSYLGEDGITPFLQPDHGAFALVRTSNPSGDAIQNLVLKDGRTVAHAVAELVSTIGSNHVGTRGYSSLGAVVGATKREDAVSLRRIMPQQVFLVPGYGAQGGGIDDVLPCFNTDGTGAIVTASRSVIYAFKPDDPKWTEAVGEAAARFADDVSRAVGLRV